MTIQITNPGAKLGQAIGEKMEQALDNKLRALTDALGYHYLCSGSIIGGERKKWELHRIVAMPGFLKKRLDKTATCATLWLPSIEKASKFLMEV